MMAINKVMLLGNLGKDPELRYTNQQFPVAKFSLATGERRKDASGNWGEHTEWHNIVAFGKTAELCSQYLKKGRQVFIEGRIQTRKWQDKEGKDRWTTEIIANNVQFVGNKPGAGTDSGASYTVETTNAGNELLDSLPSADQVSAAAEPPAFDDDDIPF
ncbi:MAG: single-stranded DNA-binding protein [Oligoflexia bacterium]|nr:single-stranded DNA-binding protein [Oligoflexia bacterium]